MKWIIPQHKMRQQIKRPKNLRAHLSPTYNAPKWILGKKSKSCWQKKILKLRLCVRSNDVVLQSPTTTCIPIETQVTLGNCNFPDIFAFWWIISFSLKRKSCYDFQCFFCKHEEESLKHESFHRTTRVLGKIANCFLRLPKQQRKSCRSISK